MYDFVVIYKRTPISGMWGEVISCKRAFQLFGFEKSRQLYVAVSIPNKIY